MRNYALEIKEASETTYSYATGWFVLSYIPLVLMTFSAYPQILRRCAHYREYSVKFVTEMISDFPESYNLHRGIPRTRERERERDF